MDIKFKDKLLEYRKSLGIKTQTEMAEKLGIKRQFYSNVESGYRPPSRQMIEKLVKFSGKPEYYWLYDIDDQEVEFVNERKEFKCLYTVLESLNETDLLDLDSNDNWSDDVKNLLLNALKADIIHMRLKNKITNK